MVNTNWKIQIISPSPWKRKKKSLQNKHSKSWVQISFLYIVKSQYELVFRFRRRHDIWDPWHRLEINTAFHRKIVLWDLCQKICHLSFEFHAKCCVKNPHCTHCIYVISVVCTEFPGQTLTLYCVIVQFADPGRTTCFYLIYSSMEYITCKCKI